MFGMFAATTRNPHTPTASTARGMSSSTASNGLPVGGSAPPVNGDTRHILSAVDPEVSRCLFLGNPSRATRPILTRPSHPRRGPHAAGEAIWRPQ